MVSPCDSIDIVTNPNGGVSIEVMVGWNINSPLNIISVDSEGNVLGEAPQMNDVLAKYGEGYNGPIDLLGGGEKKKN